MIPVIPYSFYFCSFWTATLFFLIFPPLLRCRGNVVINCRTVNVLSCRWWNAYTLNTSPNRSFLTKATFWFLGSINSSLLLLIYLCIRDTTFGKVYMVLCWETPSRLCITLRRSGLTLKIWWTAISMRVSLGAIGSDWTFSSSLGLFYFKVSFLGTGSRTHAICFTTIPIISDTCNAFWLRANSNSSEQRTIFRFSGSYSPSIIITDFKKI